MARETHPVLASLARHLRPSGAPAPAGPHPASAQPTAAVKAEPPPAAAGEGGALTPEQRREYETKGFVVLRGAIPPAEHEVRLRHLCTLALILFAIGADMTNSRGRFFIING